MASQFTERRVVHGYRCEQNELLANRQSGPLSERRDGLNYRRNCAYSSRSLRARCLEVERITHVALVWARGRRDVLGLAKVGSWAREEATLESDLDLILLTGDGDAYLKDDEWIEDLDWIRHPN
jgi:UTP:GlnB (protein PII) uridylyltransferase